MARYRSRRSSRRSTSRSAASLLALALPAPIQRVADTRLGPLLMLVGVPSMLVAGLLQINWSNGLPTVAVDPQVAASVLQRTREEYNNLDQQGGLGHLASDFLSGVSHASHQYGQTFPATQQTTQSRVPTANFPSTQPQSPLNQYTTLPQATTPQTATPWGHSSTQAQQSTYSPQPTYAQPPTYAQQPTYSQSGYYPSAPSPSDNRNLTQQQLYQQQQYQQQQQQLYEQQLRDQQYRQWLAQQQASTQLPNAQPRLSTGAQLQYDSYGRPVSTGYAQPSTNQSQPTTQYGQRNYSPGNVPGTGSASTWSNGRY
jgi:hypothetical protein